MARVKQEVRDYKAELMQDLQLARETEASVTTASNWISFKNGRIKVDNAEVPGGTMDVVVLDYILENKFFASQYDPDNPEAPCCFAFARVKGELGPHEKSEAPQHATCDGCPQAKWGSEPQRKKGKACKETRRLAVITAEEAENNPLGAEVRLISLSPTNCASWSGYVRNVGDVFQLPPHGVVTRITVTPDDKTQVKVAFQIVDPLPEAALPGVIEKRALIQDDLWRPWEVIAKADPPPTNTKLNRRR